MLFYVNNCQDYNRISYIYFLLTVWLLLQKHIQNCHLCKSGKTCYQLLQVSLVIPKHTATHHYH